MKTKASKSERRLVIRRHDPSMWIVTSVVMILVGVAVLLLWLGFYSASNFTSADDEMLVVSLAVNYPAPQLALQNLNGTNESLADFRKDILVVNNWATWCPPCKAEIPTLEDYYESHSAQDFMIVAVEAGDPKDTVSQFAQSHDLKFHVWTDPQNASLAVFKNENLPNSYVIDRTGTVRYAWTGAISRDMLEKYVTPLLTQSN